MNKILNLYAGIGGNRKNWKNCEVTAVENDQATAEIYTKLYPNDEIVLTDAHAYLLNNFEQINKTYDLVWASPPCQSHSRIRAMGSKIKYQPIYFDENLWQTIILMQTYSKKKWIVENVITYYKALIPPQAIINRHYFWSNFNITPKTFKKRDIKHKNITGQSTIYDINIKKYYGPKKREMLRSLIDPAIGEHLYNCALKSHEQEQMQLIR